MTLKDKPAYPLPLGDKQIDKTVAGETMFESFVKAAMQVNLRLHTGHMTYSQIATMSIEMALAQIEAPEKHYEAEKEKKK